MMMSGPPQSSHLPGRSLHTLQVANNRLSESVDIVHLVECPSISVLDLQNNKLEDPACLDILATMPDLRVLQMQGNPLTRKVRYEMLWIFLIFFVE